MTLLRESNPGLERKVEELTRELKRARDHGAAVSEVLRVISRSQTNVQPVLDTVAERAAILCDAPRASVWLVEGDMLRRMSAHSREAGPMATPDERVVPISRGHVSGRAVLERRVVHIEDIVPLRDTEYPDGSREPSRLDLRALLVVPLLREGNAIGTISLGRREAGLFSKEQVVLLQTFADQAVIAIENVRLFQELQARNRDLTETLEQQTATAEILRVISSSPTDTQPVLDAVAAGAGRLCDASDVAILRLEEGLLRFAASYGSIPQVPEVGEGLPLDRGLVSGRAVIDRRTIHVHDLAADSTEFPIGRTYATRLGFRTMLATPLLREGQAIGAIAIRRPDVRPFSDQQIKLLEIFADQAAIAIENVRLFQELQTKNRELTETLEQQTATAEILKVISSSPTDVAPVFEEILRAAARLCHASIAAVWRFDGRLLHLVATHNYPIDTLAQLASKYPMPPDASRTSGRVILSGEVVRQDDALSDPTYDRATAEAGGWRRMLGVPMLRERVPIGAIVVAWPDPGETPDRQVELLQTFADQAVIAIENVRLFNETKEALDHQKASAEVLQVISSSVADTQPVFEKIVESCQRLFEGCNVGINLVRDDGGIHLTAYRGPNRTAVERHFPVPLSPESGSGAAILDRRVIHYPDTQVPGVPDYARRGSKIGGNRSALFAPMLWEGRGIGAIFVGRPFAGEFSEKEIALLRTFADQAVIAIENVRLFKELQTKNHELTEALEQQTATAEILRVISGSPSDIQPVFAEIMRAAARLCGSSLAAIFRFESGMIHLAATHNWPAEALALLAARYPMAPDLRLIPGRVLASGRVVRIKDALTDPGYDNAAAVAGGWRRMLGVPMLREGVPIGAIVVTWREPGETPVRQVEILRTFADQAVIAIENVRLFQELQARTRELGRSVEELKALGDVGRAVSSTLDLDRVLTTIVARALELAGADGGTISEYDEATQQFHLKTTYGVEEELVELIRAAPLRRGEGITGKAAATRVPVQVADILDEKAYEVVRVREIMARLGYRSALAVPLLREERIVGSLTVWRRQVGHFGPDIVNLLQTFATQSTLAIQHARLFRQLEEKSRELELASRHKSEFLANMSHELRTPLNAVLGYTELVLDSIYGEVPEKIRDVMARIDKSGRHLLGLINDILDLSKIEAGQLALSLADYSMKELVQTVFAAVESLAADKKLALKVDVAADLPRGRGDERRLSQVLLNLVGNALKFTEAGEIRVRAGLEDGQFVVSVADKGPGISALDQARIFEAFQQVDSSVTRKKGGTGLGLSIARRIVELHGGRLWVESVPGKGSTFSFMVPVRVERQVMQ